MTVYFEGNGNPRPATYDEVRDLVVNTIQQRRDEVLSQVADVYGESYEGQRAAANGMANAIMAIIDGNDPQCPAFSLVAQSTPEEVQEAKDSGGNWIPTAEESPVDLSGCMAEYWSAINT